MYTGMAIGIMIALLLMVIIVLMVVGYVRKHRRKNSWGIPNNATSVPNPMYGNNQSKST
jgi:Tfp pilus assembly protein PilV